MSIAQDKTALDHASTMVADIDALLARHDRKRSTVIQIFPLNEGLACEAEEAARQCEAEYRQRGYQVSRHQTRHGNPYIKAVAA